MNSLFLGSVLTLNIFYQLEERVKKQAAFDKLMLQITSHNQQVLQWDEGISIILHGHSFHQKQSNDDNLFQNQVKR
jgi:hypothetical protein